MMSLARVGSARRLSGVHPAFVVKTLLSIPEQYGSRRRRLAIDEHICRSVRSEICELDVIFTIYVLADRPGCILAFGCAWNIASLCRVVRVIAVDVATDLGRVRQSALQAQQRIDLHQIFEGDVWKLGDSARPVR